MGVESDTFFVSLSAIGLITTLISNAISTTFIPIITDIEVKHGKEQKNKFINNLTIIVLIISFLIIFLLWFISPYLIKLIASGFNIDQLALAVKLFKIGLPTIIFSGLIGISTGYLQSENKFFSTSLGGFPLNLVYIIYLVFLSSKYGIFGLMVSSTIAIFCQFLIQIPEIKKSGYKFEFKIDFKDKYLKQMLYLSMPVLIGVAVDDISAIIDKTMASRLPIGSISALNYGNMITTIVLGVFITAIATVIFPVLSKQISSGNNEKILSTINKGIKYILIISVPSTFFLIFLSAPIVRILFERGAFYYKDTLMTSHALIFYSIGLVALSLRIFITKVFYSFQNSKIPMLNGVLTVMINIILNFILVKFLRQNGLALATSVSTIIGTLILFVKMKKKVSDINLKSYLIYTFKLLLSSFFMALFSLFAYNLLIGWFDVGKTFDIIALIISLLLGVIIYFWGCFILKIEELVNFKIKLINIIKLKISNSNSN